MATGDMLTSVFGGFVTFAIIGYMANELHLPIHKVATHGNSNDFKPNAAIALQSSAVVVFLYLLI